MTSLRGCSSPSESSSIACGSSAATPLGPSGRPMSVDVSTSRDSRPSAWPSCEPNAMPPIWVIIAISGPAIALASSGSAEAHTDEICSAIGSHSRFQVSRVLSTHSPGVHATALTAPAGRAVAPSSQVSARCTASEMAEDGGGRDRRDEPDGVRRQLAGQVIVHRPRAAAGHRRARTAEHLAELGEDLAEVGRVEVAAAEPERVVGAGVSVLLRLVAVGVVAGGEAEGQVSHTSTVLTWAPGRPTGDQLSVNRAPARLRLLLAA